MRILYSAIDQTVPGTTGGSVHVTAVAEGLAALGHEVHVLVTPGDGPFPSAPASNPVRWMPMAPPFGAEQLRWCAPARCARLVATLQPAVVIERYYNFGGEGHHGGVRGRRQDRARGQRAGHRSCGFGQGAPRPRAHLRADAPVARATSAPAPTSSSRRAPRSFRRTRRRERSCASSGAPIRIASVRTHRARHRSRGRR